MKIILNGLDAKFTHINRQGTYSFKNHKPARFTLPSRDLKGNNINYLNLK